MATESARGHFFNIDNLEGGIARKLVEGMDARIFIGENVMISLVEIAAGAKGTLHSHPQEQWGLLLEGSGLRSQGGEVVPVKKGDFWQTPGNVEHTFEAGLDGAKILDIFSPPRDEYRSAGEGFGEDT